MQAYSLKKSDGEQYKVLIVENSEIHLMLAKNIFKNIDCHVDIVESGAEAIGKIRNNNYDIIFLECDIPGANGYEITQFIRDYENDNNKFVKKTPIIAITSNIMSQSKDKCLKSGMNDFLIKPLRTPNILAMIDKWCIQTDNYKNQW